MSDTEDVAIDAPESVNMERTEVIERKSPETSVMESLHSKLMNHYKKGMKKPNVKFLSSPLTPDAVNKMAVPLYLFTIISTFQIGMFHVMPLMYEGRDDLIQLQQSFMVFLFIEIMINWLGIRYADSSYKRFIAKYGDPRLKTLSNDKSVNGKWNIMGHSAIPVSSLSKNSIRSRNESSDPVLEAERANAKMNLINDQVNSKSIDDLIGHPNDGVFDGARDISVDVLELSSHNSTSFIAPNPKVTTDGKTVFQSYPYWSWVPCYDCQRARPPRCHHCPVCRTCVLKRDHHCFFAGSCVGYRNHRFFFVFLVYAFIGCAYATVHGFPYIAYYLWQDMSVWDLFFLTSILRCIMGYVSFHTALSVTTLSLLLYFDVLTLTFVFLHCRLIYQGSTSFEKAFLSRSLKIKDTKNLKRKIRAVLGPYWAVGFILPTNFLFEPDEDPVTWPDIEVYKE